MVTDYHALGHLSTKDKGPARFLRRCFACTNLSAIGLSYPPANAGFQVKMGTYIA